MKRIVLTFLFLVTSYCIFSQADLENNNFVQRYYYKDNVVSIEKFYGDDKKLDSLKSYYKSGELNEEFHYLKGRYDGLSYNYNKKGEKLTSWEFNNGKLIERIDHKIEFNKKTEEKVKDAHSKLIILNDKLKRNSNDFKSTFKRASIRHYLGNKTLALNDFKKIEKKVLKLSKTKKIPEKIVGSMFDHLGDIYSSYEMLNHAIHYRHKAIKASPSESRLYYNLGAYLVKIKSYRLAINYLKKAIEMVPDHSFSNWALSIAYSDLEDYENALTCVNIAFKNEANLYKRGRGKAERDLWTTRGFIYHKLGETDKGIADLEEALNIDKDNSFAHRNLGIIYYEIGNYNLACQHLQKAKDLGYEKIYDRFDIQEYLDDACNKANELNEDLVVKSEPITISRFNDKPYVYPNPGKDIVKIKNPSFKNFTYQIYDYTSKLVFENSSSDGSVFINNLPQGVYILKIRGEEGIVETLRFIKE